MGTHSIILIRERDDKGKGHSALGGPAGSQYFYEYYACIYQHYDGYVEEGMGEWLVNFFSNFTYNFEEQGAYHVYVNTGLLGTRLVNAFYTSNFKNPRLVPIASLEKLFQSDYDYAYIITIDLTSPSDLIDDQSVMLSVYDRDFILTARPEKFLAKYKYYKTQMEEMKKSFAEIDYGDDEVEKEGYFSEDQLLIEFLRKIPRRF